jgi:hypothetical protein
MNRSSIARLFAIATVTFMLSPVVLADPPQGKGKSAAQGGSAVDHGPPQGKAGVPNDDRYDDHHGDDKGKGKEDAQDNRGQTVSECNQRANERKLKGKDRQEFVEWCTDHGAQSQYSERSYNEDRGCYRKADEKGLSGDKRRNFINECVRRQEQKPAQENVGTYGEPRGKDVQGKGGTHK